MRLNYNLSMWGYEAYTWPETLEEAVAEARRSGYGVELWPSWKDQTNLFAKGSRARIVRLLKDVPSSLHSGAVYTLEDHKMQIDAARDTKSPIVVVHADHLGLLERPNDYKLAGEVVSYAKENGVTIALENADLTGMLDTLTGALDAISDLRVCLDVGHVYGDHKYSMRDYLKRTGERIAHVHLQDVYFASGTHRAREDSHRVPGQCDIPLPDWQQFLSTLKKNNFKGFAVLEFRPFTPIETASQVREFLDSIDG